MLKSFIQGFMLCDTFTKALIIGLVVLYVILVLVVKSLVKEFEK